MSTLLHSLGIEPEPHPLRTAFLRWQCRVRQLAMREAGGRPDDAITPSLWLPDSDEPLGHVITVLSKAPAHSVTSELQHMVRKTNDPAQRREQALTYFSAAYYQQPEQFSDTLTATFPPGSPGAARIRAAERCRLRFEAYAQVFELACRVWPLDGDDPLYQATWWHNQLFNPALDADTEILGFEPDWQRSRADPEIPGR